MFGSLAFYSKCVKQLPILLESWLLRRDHVCGWPATNVPSLEKFGSGVAWLFYLPRGSVVNQVVLARPLVELACVYLAGRGQAA